MYIVDSFKNKIGLVSADELTYAGAYQNKENKLTIACAYATDNAYVYPTLVAMTSLTENAAKKLNGVTVQKNDVLINITGDSVARTCIVPDNVLPARVNFLFSSSITMSPQPDTQQVPIPRATTAA